MLSEECGLEVVPPADGQDNDSFADCFIKTRIPNFSTKSCFTADTAQRGLKEKAMRRQEEPSTEGKKQFTVQPGTFASPPHWGFTT